MKAHSCKPIGRYTTDTPLGVIQLATDEKFVSITESRLAAPVSKPDPMDILLQMSGVSTSDQLGDQGAPLASVANPENIHNDEVRRYEARFGRDALYAAEFLSNKFPQLELGIVRYLAAYQARVFDERSQAAPGKVPNHIRRPDDRLAQQLTAETGRKWPWFGGTDTTVQFLLAAARVLRADPGAGSEFLRYPPDHPSAGEHVVWGTSRRTLNDAVTDAAGWLVRELDSRPGPPLIWVPMNRKDSFTVWTDSPNSFHWRNGRLAQPPVAPVQLQAQTFDALIALAELPLNKSEHIRTPRFLLGLAAQLKQAILRLFFVNDDRGEYFANGVAAAHNNELSALDVRTVNMGFLLDSALLEESEYLSYREAITEQMLSPAMLSPFGIVGRARDEVRFEKFDYHSQIYAFAAHKVANGLRRAGYPHLAQAVDSRILAQTTDGFYPENVGAGEVSRLEYCPHILTISRIAADGRLTVSVKERTPAPYAVWTVAAILDIQQRLSHEKLKYPTKPSALEQRLLPQLGPNAYLDI
jgi:glycogen debranching enzyme